MTDDGLDQSDDRRHHPSPWWLGLGPAGAIGLIVIGIVAAVWAFFQLPGAQDDQVTGYYQAGKVIAIGLVVAGTTMLGRNRARASHTEEMKESERG